MAHHVVVCPRLGRQLPANAVSHPPTPPVLASARWPVDGVARLSSSVPQADVALFSSFMFDSQAPRDLLSFVTDTINRAPQVRV